MQTTLCKLTIDNVQSTEKIIYSYHGQLKISKLNIQNLYTTDIQLKMYKLMVYKLRMYNVTILSNKSKVHITLVIMME